MEYSSHQVSIFKALRLAKQRRSKDQKYNIFVGAVAGSGKSFTLLQGTREIHEKYPDDEILVLAFNNHIVKELEEKAGKRWGLTIKTSHSFGFSVLKMNGHTAKLVGKYAKSKYYHIIKAIVDARYDEFIIPFVPGPMQEQVRMNINNQRLAPEQIKDVIKTAERKCTNQFQTLVKFVMLTQTDMDDIDDIHVMVDKLKLEVTVPFLYQFVAEVINEGIRQVKEKVAISFEDMIVMPLYLNCRFPDPDWILVDECQDLNEASLELICRAAKKGIIAAFGDVRQAIMAFTGAMSDGVARFMDKADGRPYPLTCCYRCDLSIIDLAQVIVPEIHARPDAAEGMVQLTDKNEILKIAAEGDYVICRLTAPLVNMCINFIRVGKPARVKGSDIGLKLIETIEEVAKTYECKSLDEFIACFGEYRSAMMAQCVARKTPATTVSNLNDEYDCIEAVAYHVGKPLQSQPGKFISYNALKDQINIIFDDKITTKFVYLCTVHRSKGLEGNNVFILEADKMPFKMKNRVQTPEQYTQEMNLLYVAITRAKHRLYIDYPGILTAQEYKSKLMQLTAGPECATV